jgi:hypothetical protein
MMDCSKRKRKKNSLRFSFVKKQIIFLQKIYSNVENIIKCVNVDGLKKSKLEITSNPLLNVT